MRSRVSIAKQPYRFETDGPEKLQSVMQKREAVSGVRAWLFDENGKALGGGPTGSALLRKESWLARLLAKSARTTSR